MSRRFNKGYAGQGVLTDPTLGIFLDWGATPPTDATPGYGVGCLWFDTDAAAGSQWLRNDGTLASCDFNVINGGIDLALLTATAAELNMAADNSTNSEVVTATNVLTAAESGKTFFLDAAAGFLTTLPAPFLGARFRFVVKTAPTSVGYTIGTPTANIFYGMFVERAGGAGVAGAAQDLITLVANQAIIADWCEMYSDGTNWYVHGMVNVAAGVTFAVT